MGCVLAGFEDVSVGFDGKLDSADKAMRAAAFAHVSRLAQIHDSLTSEHLRAGFTYEGERLPLINPQRGIFKPRQMTNLLSVLTAFPRRGRRVWYDDQRDVHVRIFDGDESVDYAFMGDNPNAADNRWLRQAMLIQVPIIYFLGISPGHYQAILPSFVIGFDAAALKARIAFGISKELTAAPETPAERRYALREVRQRLHQASFREAVISAYKGKCALSGLPEPLLLDAAHIVEDANERFGQPIVQNGIPLSKIHHAAFDAHMIGIDPDYGIHISKRLLELRDGPMLEALKRLNGGKLHTPGRLKDAPDRDRLALRFAQFRAAA